MSEPYLLMWLEAPLQSWGHYSKFGRRDSQDFPTKSGVLGLLCCALGAAGEQKEWLKKWADRDFTVQAFVRTKNGNKVQREPMLRDFHMVGSGYNDASPWQTLLIPKKSDGTKAVGGGAKMTYRFYVQDMAYAVLLQAPQTELENLQWALQNPVWDLYLGRKNCVPTDFIARGIFADLNDALIAAKKIAAEKDREIIFSVLQGEHDGEILTLNDVPLQFGIQKIYRDRRVTVVQEK